MKIHVNTADFRKALQSVLPHAHDDPETFYAIVRGVVTQENVYLQSTNLYTAGMAIASVWEHEGLTGSLAEDSFDLSVGMAKELLQLFKAKKKPENELDDQLSLEVSEAEIAVTDVSGLFPGKSLTLPNSARAPELFPNLPRMFGNAMGGRVVPPVRIIAAGKLLKLFAAASSAYGHPLTVEATSSKKQMLLSCGDAFLGMLTQVDASVDTEFSKELAEWRAGWQRRLPEVAFALGASDVEEAA